MKTQIIEIGNSRGIRIPKPLLEKAGLEGEVEITAKEGLLMIQRSRKSRAGWAAAFEELAKRVDDALLDSSAPALSSWDQAEWEWE